MPTAQQTSADELPEGVDPDEAVKQLIIPSVNHYGARGRKQALREAYKLLREHQTLSASAIIKEVYHGSFMDENALFNSDKWYLDYFEPYFRLLPGVQQNGYRIWTFDPSTATRSPVPENPEKPLPWRAKMKLKEFGFYEEKWDEVAILNYATVRDAYFSLQEQGTRTRDQLAHFFNPANPYSSDYANRSDWWARVGRPALDQMPDVERPLMPAGEWRYIGIGEGSA